MSEEQNPERVANRRTSDNAVADSTPDFNVLIANAGRSMLKPLLPFVGPDNKVHKFTLLNTARMGAAMWIITLLIFFVTALPSLVGATLLFDKIGEERSRARGFQLDMFKLQTDLEIAKLDRTMLGEGAMTTLNSIATKIDQQGQAIKDQGEAIKGQGEAMTKLSAEVAALTKGQAAADRRIAGVKAEQNALKSRVQAQGQALTQPARPAPRPP